MKEQKNNSHNHKKIIIYNFETFDGYVSIAQACINSLINTKCINCEQSDILLSTIQGMLHATIVKINLLAYIE